MRLNSYDLEIPQVAQHIVEYAQKHGMDKAVCILFKKDEDGTIGIRLFNAKADEGEVLSILSMAEHVTREMIFSPSDEE